jgi:hypothetical protein
MSLFNETVLRTYGQTAIVGQVLTLIEGDWSDQRQVGLGFPNHPEVIVPKAALLAADSMEAWLANEELPLTESLLALIALVEPQLQMTADIGYLWVSLLRQGNVAGEGAYDPSERLVFWVIAQLQAAAHGTLQDAPAPDVSGT